MNRRVAAAFIAALLALGAFISIFLYVRNADIRAQNGAALQQVYVVVNPISKGTLASALGNNVAKIDVQTKTVPDNAVYNLDQIANQAASVDLVPNEILLTSRFVDPAVASQDSVAVPAGMQQVSLLLKPEQVRGGFVKAGETVGIFATIKFSQDQPYNVPGIGKVALEGGSDNLSKQILSKVLVTRVQGGTTTTADSAGNTALPDTSVLITVALVTSDIEKLTWAQSQGTLLLSVENKDANDSSSQYTDGAVVLR